MRHHWIIAKRGQATMKVSPLIFVRNNATASNADERAMIVEPIGTSSFPHPDTDASPQREALIELRKERLVPPLALVTV